MPTFKNLNKNQNPFETNRQWQASLKNEETWLQDLLKTVKRELSHAPEGSLTITNKGNRIWFRQRTGGDHPATTYISQKNQELICRLAQKRYDQQLLRTVEEELTQIQKGQALSFQDLSAVYEGMPELWKPFVEPHVLPDKLYVEQWIKLYELSSTGDSFKSKSEHLLNRIFKDLEVPHVYEPALYLEGYGTVRPDFVVLNTRTRQTFYHEHFGMMDDPDYCKKALAKLRDYHRNGFYEGENLIITMESSRHPMVPEEVEELFRHYLT